MFEIMNTSINRIILERFYINIVVMRIVITNNIKINIIILVSSNHCTKQLLQ